MLRFFSLLFVAFLAIVQVSALSSSQELEIKDLTNAQRIQRGLPLKQPTRRSTRTLVPRADPSTAAGQTGRIAVTPQTNSPFVPRAAAAGYLKYDAASNRFQVTATETDGTLFKIPSSSGGGPGQFQVYTDNGVYNVGHITTDAGPQTSRALVATSGTDSGSPTGKVEQTSVFSWTAFSSGSNGALTVRYFPASDAASDLYLRIINGNLIGTTVQPATTNDNPVKLSVVYTTATPVKTTPGDPVLTPSGSDTNVDPGLTQVDDNINSGGLSDAEIACANCLYNNPDPQPGTGQCDSICAGTGMGP